MQVAQQHLHFTSQPLATPRQPSNLSVGSASALTLDHLKGYPGDGQVKTPTKCKHERQFIRLPCNRIANIYCSNYPQGSLTSRMTYRRAQCKVNILILCVTIIQILLKYIPDFFVQMYSLSKNILNILCQMFSFILKNEHYCNLPHMASGFSLIGKIDVRYKAYGVHIVKIWLTAVIHHLQCLIHSTIKS